MLSCSQRRILKEFGEHDVLPNRATNPTSQGLEQARSVFFAPRDFASSEFADALSSTSLVAAPDSPAAGRYDLLTVIAHEFGHVFGFEHSQEQGLMAEQLPVGVRLLPTVDTVIVEMFATEPSPSGEVVDKGRSAEIPSNALVANQERTIPLTSFGANLTSFLASDHGAGRMEPIMERDAFFGSLAHTRDWVGVMVSSAAQSLVSEPTSRVESSETATSAETDSTLLSSGDGSGTDVEENNDAIDLLVDDELLGLLAAEQHSLHGQLL